MDFVLHGIGPVFEKGMEVSMGYEKKMADEFAAVPKSSPEHAAAKAAYNRGCVDRQSGSFSMGW